MLSLFLVLLGAHFIGDYALQSDYLAANKGKSLYVLTAHSAIWTFCIVMTAVFARGIATPAWVMLLVLFIPHFVIDKMKVRGLYFFSGLTPKSALAVDQLLHYAQILLFIGFTVN